MGYEAAAGHVRVRTTVNATHPWMHNPLHTLDAEVRTDLDDKPSDPHGFALENTVLALRALADHIEQTISGPPIIGKTEIIRTHG